MAEWSKALRSGRSPVLWAWVQIPLLTRNFAWLKEDYYFFLNKQNYKTPNKGLEPLTSGLKVPRSTDWANPAYQILFYLKQC